MLSTNKSPLNLKNKELNTRKGTCLKGTLQSHPTPHTKTLKIYIYILEKSEKEYTIRELKQQQQNTTYIIFQKNYPAIFFPNNLTLISSTM